MKVVTKVVNIEGLEFALISDVSNGRKYYGTIPYSELDENGCMKRELNGFQMCISFESVAKAIEERTNRVKTDRFRDEGHNEREVLMFIASGYTSDNWDMEMYEKIMNLPL